MHEADASKVNQIIMGVREISNEDMELFQTQKTTANEKETDDLFRPKKRRQQKSETSESIATSSISGKRFSSSYISI